MFFLATVADTIRIAPTHFSGGDDLALIAAINAAYPDRTLMDVGLVVSLYDVLTVGSALIHAGDGAAHFEVVFRVVVFKPFVGECVTAKVTECTQAGIRLSIDFFDNIAVPYYNIFEPNHFDKAKKRWVWDDHQNDEEGAEGEEAKEPEEDSQLEIRKGDFIRFTVESLQVRAQDVEGKRDTGQSKHTLESESKGLSGAAGERATGEQSAVVFTPC